MKKGTSTGQVCDKSDNVQIRREARRCNSVKCWPRSTKDHIENLVAVFLNSVLRLLAPEHTSDVSLAI